MQTRIYLGLQCKILTSKVSTLSAGNFCQKLFSHISGSHFYMWVEFLEKRKTYEMEKDNHFNKIINAQWDTLVLLCKNNFFSACKAILWLNCFFYFFEIHFFRDTKHAVGILSRRYYSRGISPHITKHLFHEANITLYFVDNLLHGIHNLTGLFHYADSPNRSQ